MNNRIVFSLLSAALIVLPTLSHAGESQFNLLRSYKLANGQGVAIAMPGGWQELSKTRVLEPGSAARFLDESGRPIEISAAALERASKARSVVWAEKYVNTRVATK
jgi:hypothetical protein